MRWTANTVIALYSMGGAFDGTFPRAVVLIDFWNAAGGVYYINPWQQPWNRG